MNNTTQTIAGFPVVAFKIHEVERLVLSGRAYVPRKVWTVECWLRRDGGAAPESAMWTGRNCDERKFPSADAARRNALAAFGQVMER